MLQNISIIKRKRYNLTLKKSLEKCHDHQIIPVVPFVFRQLKSDYTNVGPCKEFETRERKGQRMVMRSRTDLPVAEPQDIDRSNDRILRTNSML